MKAIKETGTLFLIPTPLSEDTEMQLDEYAKSIIHSLKIFIVEKSKTARQFIKTTNPPYTQQEILVVELDKHKPTYELEGIYRKLQQGESVGLISEAGCPGVADPGADIVMKAHQLGAKVRPIVGPSSILLALMASGMNGQQFCFHGYLPQDRYGLAQQLQRLEQESLKYKQTQIWIETPYRNNQMIETCLSSLRSGTQFCIAADLTSKNERIYSGKISSWKKDQLGELHKVPAVYLLLA